VKAPTLNWWLAYSTGLLAGHYLCFSWLSLAIAIPGLYVALWVKDRLEAK
jgi:hypothetical protein